MSSTLTFKPGASARSGLSRQGRTASSPPLASLVLIISLVPGLATATTYYVDPAGGTNSNSGTSATTPWRTPPGTRNTANSGFVSSNWGSVSTTAKIACGDTILLKGGATQTSAQGGAWLIDPAYYRTNCTAATPITIRVATSTEWGGSTGPFTLNGTGITPASSQYNWSDHAAGIMVSVRGVKLVGAGPTQRLVVTNMSGRSIVVACNHAAACVSVDDFRGQWWDLNHSAWGFDIGEADHWQVSDSIGQFIANDVWNIGLDIDHYARNGAFVDVEAANSGCGSLGNPSCTSAAYNDAFKWLHAENVWCVRCSIHGNGTGAVSIGVAYNPNMNNDWNSRFRDLVSWGNGVATVCAVNSCVGFKTSGNEWYNSSVVRGFLNGAIIWGNRGTGVHAYAGDYLEAWNVTTYNNDLGGTSQGSYQFDATGRDFRIFNGIDVRARTAVTAFAVNNSGGPSQQRTYTPTVHDASLPVPLSADTEALGATYPGTAWPGTRTYAAPPSWFGQANKTTRATCDPKFVALSTSSFAANDFHLTAGSTAIDAGRSYLVANGAGSGNTVTVKSNGGSGDPRNYLIAPDSYLGVQPNETLMRIQGACGIRRVVSMTATTVTFDGAPCSWLDNAMVHTPWSGAAPDMGALESGGGFAFAPPTLISVTPVP